MKTPRICVAIPGYTTEFILKEYNLISKYNPNLIEVRLDYRESELDLELIRMKIDTLLIATNRRSDQGGLSQEPEEERVSGLINAAKLGWDYVDIAFTTPKLRQLAELVHGQKARLIVSYHDFESTPEPSTYKKILDECREYGAYLCKIVCTAVSYTDNLICLDFLTDNPGNVSFLMGKYGFPSRILSPFFGGLYTYASTESGKEVAPGQISIESLRSIYMLMGVP